MRVLLARPPRRDSRDAGLPVPPLGLAYLAGTLQAANRPVELLDAYALGWSWERFEQELARRRPDVLGLGTMTPVRDIAWRAARMARPHVGTLILGGPHATAVGEAVFEECPELDHLAIGEAEESIVPYLDWVAAGARGDPPDGILAPGRRFLPREPTQRIQDISWPLRSALPRGSYRYLMATRPGFTTMITSRGCPFRCSFCDKSVGGSRWRARPAEDVVDEFAALAADGIGFVNLYDDNFTLHKGRVAAICEALLRRGVDIEWKCEGRVDGVDLPLLRLMRRAGCRVVAYGVESGNADSLALLRKDVSLERAERAFAETREAGLRSLAYMILGVPGEGAEEVRQSAAFVRALGADYVQFSSLVALPGTPLFNQQRVLGGDVRNPLDGDVHRRAISDLPPEELSGLLREAWFDFYLRPRPLSRLARDAVASGAWREAGRLGLAMARWGLESAPS